MLRILLFLLTNAAILVLISITFSLLGIEGILHQNGVGLDLNALLVMSAVIGFSGSIISLFLSKWMAKSSMGVQVIEQPASPVERWLVDTVRRQCERAGIGMPEVGIFDSPDPNAFATGWNRNSALVAVSTGLLQQMSQDEVEAVLGHEVSHVANGDMVTLTLIQGVVNTFVVFLSRVIGYTVDRLVFKNERGHGIAYFVTSMIAELVLAVLASMIVMWFSRRREFHADSGGADLAGRQKMISALQRLQAAHDPQPLPDEMAAFGISGGRVAGWRRLFLTHPPLEERIDALRQQSGAVRRR
jgi:heat shock protein HtpX